MRQNARAQNPYNSDNGENKNAKLVLPGWDCTFGIPTVSSYTYEGNNLLMISYPTGKKSAATFFVNNLYINDRGVLTYLSNLTQCN